MELIFAAALCSVVVSILLKIAKKQGFNPMQLIAWNYVAASVLCFYWFKPDFSQVSVSDTPWLLILALGVLLPSVFLFLAKSLQRAGILKTEVAQRLSVVLSLTAAYFIFQEQFTQLKVLGIGLGVIAVLCVLFSNRQNTTSGNQGLIYLALVWLGYALIDVLLKYTTSLGLQFALTLNLMFICAFICSMLYILLKYKSFGDFKHLGLGFVLGGLNFANIALYVNAHRLLKDSPAIVFAGMNILVVVLGVLAGVLLFKERMQTMTATGIALACASVICLAYAMGL